MILQCPVPVKAAYDHAVFMQVMKNHDGTAAASGQRPAGLVAVRASMELITVRRTQKTHLRMNLNTISAGS
jgi:hypothetical protein